MKVLIPNFPTADSFVENVADTLRGMGHEVITPASPFGRTGPLSRLGGQAVRSLWPQRLTPGERFALAAARNHRPEMVLCLTQSLRSEVLAELRKTGVRRLVAWWGDTPANMQQMGLLSEGWDRIYLKDAAAVQKFQAVGLPAELLHEAMNTRWHRRNFTSIGDDVAVAGNYYGYRQFLALRLLAAGVRLSLYGAAPPKWSDPAVLRAFTGRYIVREEKSAVFGSALACLNSTALSEGDSLNCRAFEIAGACGLQLIEDKPSVATCFEPGREVLTYRSVQDIVSYLERAQTDRDWAISIREAAHARANAEHTYRHRLELILGAVAPGLT